jgi:hypothetical protein
MTNRTPDVQEYLALARAEDLAASTEYLKECFMKADGETLDEETMNTFMEEVIEAANAGTEAAKVETADEQPTVDGSATTEANTEVQEATSES